MLSAVKIFSFPDTNVHPSSQIHQRSSDTSQVAKCLLKHWKTRFLLSSKLSVIEEGWKLAGTCLPRAEQSHWTLTLYWLHWVLSALCSVPTTREQPPLPACSCPDFYFYFFPFKFLSIFLKLLWFTTWFAEWLTQGSVAQAEVEMCCGHEVVRKGKKLLLRLSKTNHNILKLSGFSFKSSTYSLQHFSLRKAP